VLHSNVDISLRQWEEFPVYFSHAVNAMVCYGVIGSQIVSICQWIFYHREVTLQLKSDKHSFYRRGDTIFYLFDYMYVLYLHQSVNQDYLSWKLLTDKSGEIIREITLREIG